MEQAETETPETKQRPLTEFYGGVSTSHAVEVKDKWRQDAAKGEHAPLDSDKGLKRFVLQKIDSKRI